MLLDYINRGDDMNKPYYVLSGGYDTENVGDYAMLKILQEILSQNGYEIKLLTRHNHQHLIDIYGVSQLIPNYEYDNKNLSLNKFFRGFNFGENDTHLYNIYQEILASKGLIIGGGRLLIDLTLDVMRGPLNYFASLVTLCKFINKPVYIYAMTIVPNKSDEGNKILKYIVDNSTRISVRDKDSIHYLQSIGCNQSQITYIPDPGLGLDWGKGSTSGKRVGLTVRAISHNWGGLSKKEYISKMSEIVKELQYRDFEVIGIPHQYYGIDNPDIDDRNIFKEISLESPIKFINEKVLDVNDYKAVYQSIDYLIGIRRHSFIFAAIAGVPILPFAENPNATRICKQLNTIQALSLATEMDDIIEKLNYVIENRSIIIEQQDKAVSLLSLDLKKKYKLWLFGSNK